MRCIRDLVLFPNEKLNGTESLLLGSTLHFATMHNESVFVPGVSPLTHNHKRCSGMSREMQCMRRVRNKEYFVVWCPIDLRRLVCKKWFPVVIAITNCVLGRCAALKSGAR